MARQPYNRTVDLKVDSWRALRGTAAGLNRETGPPSEQLLSEGTSGLIKGWRVCSKRCDEFDYQRVSDSMCYVSEVGNIRCRQYQTGKGNAVFGRRHIIPGETILRREKPYRTRRRYIIVQAISQFKLYCTQHQYFLRVI